MSQFHVQVISKEAIDWGESPHWDETRQKLYYVDCFTKCIHQIDPENGKCERFDIVGQYTKSMPMTIAIPTNNEDNNTFIITLGNSIAKYCQTSGDIFKLAEIESGSYFNDGKCDSNGSLWIGSFKGFQFFSVLSTVLLMINECNNF
jgi:sugar lactone lactonase YvrE